MTMMDESLPPRHIALLSISVMLQSRKKKLKVNAFLDDASTKTYLNADVAEVLGLRGKTDNEDIVRSAE